MGKVILLLLGTLCCPVSAEPFQSMWEFVEAVEQVEAPDDDNASFGRQEFQVRNRLKETAFARDNVARSLVAAMEPFERLEAAARLSRFVSNPTVVASPSRTRHANVPLWAVGVLLEDWEAPPYSFKTKELEEQLVERLRKVAFRFDGTEESHQSQLARQLLDEKMQIPAIPARKFPPVSGRRVVEKALTIQELSVVLPSPPRPASWPAWVYDYEDRLVSGLSSAAYREAAVEVLSERFGYAQLRNKEKHASDILDRAKRPGDEFYRTVLPNLVPDQPSPKLYSGLADFYRSRTVRGDPPDWAVALYGRLAEAKRFSTGEAIPDSFKTRLGPPPVQKSKVETEEQAPKEEEVEGNTLAEAKRAIAQSDDFKAIQALERLSLMTPEALGDFSERELGKVLRSALESKRGKIRHQGVLTLSGMRTQYSKTPDWMKTPAFQALLRETLRDTWRPAAKAVVPLIKSFETEDWNFGEDFVRQAIAMISTVNCTSDCEKLLFKHLGQVDWSKVPMGLYVDLIDRFSLPDSRFFTGRLPSHLIRRDFGAKAMSNPADVMRFIDVFQRALKSSDVNVQRAGVEGLKVILPHSGVSDTTRAHLDAFIKNGRGHSAHGTLPARQMHLFLKRRLRNSNCDGNLKDLVK